MWQRKTDGDRISARTHTQSSQRGLGSVKHEGGICFSARWASREKEKRGPSPLTFHINTHKCKREAVKILSTWQTDMLCRKILLSGSAAKASLQPNAVWCQKSLKHFFCAGHTPRSAPRSASASEILPHLDHWHIHCFTGWWWDPYGPNYDYFFYFFYYCRLFTQENSGWAHL